MKNIIPIFLVLLITSCGGEDKKESSITAEEPAETASETVEQASQNPDLLRGNVKITAGEQTFEFNEFDKKRSEITYMNDNQIAVRLTTLDKEVTIQMLLSGPNAYGAKPSEVTMEATQFKKGDHVSLSFQGLLGSKDEISSTTVFDGTAEVMELGEESLDVSTKFEGVAVHYQPRQERDTLNVQGSIYITLDGAADARTQ